METVREKLKKMREGQGRGGQTPTAVSSAVQSLNAIANNYSSQSFSQASTNSIPQYQQSFCPFQQQSQDVYSSALTQTPPFTPASMTPPVQHNSPNYTASSLTSTNLPYDLRDEEVDCLGETYTSSLPASSPSRSSVCSVPQQIPSPEVSPRLAASTVPSPVSHFSDASSPINYGVVNSVSSTPCGYPNEQVFNYPPATYAGKLSPMRGWSNFNVMENNTNTMSRSWEIIDFCIQVHQLLHLARCLSIHLALPISATQTNLAVSVKPHLNIVRGSEGLQ